MAYRSSVHGSSVPYRLMFGEECTLPMDVGLPQRESDLPDLITSPYAIWVRDALEVAYDQVCGHSGQAVRRQKRLCDRRAVVCRCLPWEIGFCVIIPDVGLQYHGPPFP